MVSRDCEKLIVFIGPSREYRVTMDTHKPGRIHSKGTELQRWRKARDQKRE